MMRREDFYHSLAEEMYFYKGFDEVIQTRSNAKTFQTPSPSAKKTRSNSSNSSRDLCPGNFDGHDVATLIPKPKKTRANAKQMQTETYKYGNGGRDFKFRFCFVCSRLVQKRHQTKMYCTCCQVAICPTKMLRRDKDGEPFVCWNELHQNPAMQRALVKYVYI